MTNNAKPYRESLLKRLAKPEEAEAYLKAALDDSSHAFLKALRSVVQAREVAAVAKQAGVQRETLYRALSEQGNPTLSTLSSVLYAVGLKLSVERAP